MHFISIANGSANETRHLIDYSVRLNFMDATIGNELNRRYSELIASLTSLISSLKRQPSR